SKKIDIKKVLQLVEEVENPIYLHLGDNHDSLFLDGLGPDIAWRLQRLFEDWHDAKPITFPRIQLSIYNMRLKFENSHLKTLFEFFENHVEFDRILSQRDLFTKSEIGELYPDHVTISLFKNHLEIYLKKDFTELEQIKFDKPIFANNGGAGLLIPNYDTLMSICDLIRPKILSVIDAILLKGKEMGFDQDLSTKIMKYFTDRFAIVPSIRPQELNYQQEQIEKLFMKNITSNIFALDDIVTDLDVLHYIRSLCDSPVSLEELLTKLTKFKHVAEITDSDDFEDQDLYNLAKISGKPILQTRYFRNNSHKFHIRTLDLSDIRLISQPDMKILSKLKYLQTLILSNNRASGKFDICDIEFGNFQALTSLIIQNCGISKLTSSMFRGASQLRRIFADGNTITIIDRDCFNNIPIEELHLNIPPDHNYPDEILSIIKNTPKNHQLRKNSILTSFTGN
ncbi:MAG: hypothetical protein ACXAC2_12595, partial [Candidatus Kariarchaeaceae archaeon]